MLTQATMSLQVGPWPDMGSTLEQVVVSRGTWYSLCLRTHQACPSGLPVYFCTCLVLLSLGGFPLPYYYLLFPDKRTV